MMLDVDMAKRRISLGLKQCVENPWTHFGETCPVGTVLKGEIRNITEFGLFIGLDNGILCNQSHAPFPSRGPIIPYLKRALECTAEAGGKICIIHPDNYTIRTMFKEDAIMQLELSDRPFVLYRSARRGGLTIVYRRKDGEYAALDIGEVTAPGA